MRMYDIIRKKRDGEALTKAEILYFVNGYVDGSIPDYQAAALIMAMFIRGLDDQETVRLTRAMAHSGDTLDLSRFGDVTVDKHSTGGVGDKTTLIVAPVVASLGATVAKMSGRGLGHTGGTVDKLESIPGYRTALPAEEFLEQAAKVGIAVIGQTGNLTPADKKIYALRDVTATVDAIPLIVSSIMSKKIAAGSRSIVLDVKVGSGAFMKTVEDAEKLARKMVEVGKLADRRMTAVLSDMNVPLGQDVGNALEVAEAVRVLKNESHGDLREVSEVLAAHMVRLSLGLPYEEALEKVRHAIDSGLAFAKMKEWVDAQGGDTAVLDNTDLLPKAQFRQAVLAPKDGFIVGMDTEKLGEAGVILGAGRAAIGDPIDFAAGLSILKKTGDRVEKGEPIAVLHTNNSEKLAEAEKEYLSGIRISLEEPPKRPLIYKVIT